LILLVVTRVHVQAAQDAKAVVTSFYQWYYFTSPKNVDQGLKRYLEASTYELYEQARAIEKKTHKIIIDSDPFSGVQVAVYAVRVGPATVQGNTATVPLVLTVGLHKTDNLKQNVSVVVHKVNGTWQLWNFLEAAPGGATSNFRNYLSAALARK
jgi:hypothetical protein